jgi:HAD superfamily hydrolase (TIGR01509 family)
MYKYKAIIFDFDNTLFDSTTPFTNYLKGFLLDTPYKDWDYRKFYKELNTLTGTSENIDREISTRFWAGLKGAMTGNIKPYPEDKDTLVTLHNNSIKMGIVSRSIKSKIENLLIENDMRDYFQVIVDKAQKPDPYYLRTAVTALELPVDEILYVGDEDEDIELGRNVGMDTAYCLRNNEHAQGTYLLQKDWIDNHKPTYFIHDLTELVDIIKG